MALGLFQATAEVVKLVDTLASGASRGNPVEVQVLSSAPLKQQLTTLLNFLNFRKSPQNPLHIW